MIVGGRVFDFKMDTASAGSTLVIGGNIPEGIPAFLDHVLGHDAWINAKVDHQAKGSYNGVSLPDWTSPIRVTVTRHA